MTSASNRLEVAQAPSQTLTSLTPPSGSTLGGNNVVLAGSGFTGSTQVNFGSNIILPCGSGSCFTVDSDTQITVDSVPANVAGGVPVNVVTSGGTTGNLTYTYLTPPTLTNLNPSSGSTSGGNNVILTGTNFTGATDVNFGSSDLTPCPSTPCFTFNSDTQITVDSVPPGAAGVNVNVVTPGGTTGNLTYTYVAPPPPPTLTNLNPSSGSTLGGNNVILTGTNFTGATDVNFGASDLTPCPSTPCFTFNGDTQITVDAVPAHGAGGVNVNVVTPNGTTGNLTYTYVPPPTLASLNPTSGSTAGGNSVTLTGTNFTGATDVNVGTHDLTPCPSAPCFTFNNDTQITVTMPANTPGTVNVSVVTPGGTTSSLPYTFVAPGPTVTKVSPNAGAPAGKNTVLLTGTDFEAAGTPIVSIVTVGPAAITSTPCGTTPTAPCFTVNSATSVTIEVLPAGTGMINITVTTPGGTSAKSSSNSYTYVATTPNVLTVSPKYGATSGDAYVTVVGANFGDPSQGFGATDVVFGTGGSAVDIPASNAFPCSGPAGCFEQIGTTIIDVYTPQMAAGTVDITVVTPGGSSNAGIPDQYTFVARGAFTAVNPFRTCDTRPVGSGVAANQCNTGRSGPIGPFASITAKISGGPVPTGAQAVVVNITAINRSSSATFITAFPAGGSRPVASNINLAGYAVESNLAIVQLSAGGAISLFNSAGNADVVVDIEGYFASSGGGPAGAFHTIAPLRICDSRGGTGNPWLCATASHLSSDPLTAGTWRHVVLSGLPGNVSPTTPDIPNNGTAAAAVFNLTATGGSASTFLSVAVPTSGDACPTTKPAFSNLNPSAGTTLPNRVISNLGPSQDICLYSNLGTINFLIDVNGWFGTGSATPGAFFYSVPPTRICDTRPTFGTRCQGSPLKTNFSEVIHVAGIVAVPAWNSHALPPPIAVVANLTGVVGSASTYFTLYPSDASSKPTASDLNPSAGQVIANLAVTSLAQTGTNVGNINLYNAAGSINAILDVAGWFQ